MEHSFDMMLESGCNSVLAEDLVRIAEKDIPFEMLRGGSIVITGATGLLGSMLVRALAGINQVHELDLVIIPWSARLKRRRRSSVRFCSGVMCGWSART